MKPKNIFKTWLYAVTVLGSLLVTGSPTPLRAEATREIYSDSGLYTGETGLWPVFLSNWSFSSITFEPNDLTDPSVPEGRKGFTASLPNLSDGKNFGGWGIFHDTGNETYKEFPRDYSGYSHLRFWLKSNRATLLNTTDPSRSQYILKVEIKYLKANNNNAETAVLWIPVSQPNVWTEAVVSFSSIINQFPDFNLAKITSPFIITAVNCPAGLAWSVDDIRWTKPLRTNNPLVLYPVSPDIKPNGRRQVTVEGRDSNNQLVIVYSTFSYFVPVGGTVVPVPPAKSQSGIFTVGSQSGGFVGSVLADPGNLSLGQPATLQKVFTNFTVNPSWQNKRLGVYSETISGLVLDDVNEPNANSNSAVVVFSENTNNQATLPELSLESNNPPEGNTAMKIVLREKTDSKHFQGMAIQWGRTAVDAQKLDTYTTDLSQYYEGSLRFWFKGPYQTDLDNRLLVGIRSGNVPAGKDASKVKLSDYVTFDNQWHSVTIPMSVFAKGRSFADISRTKVLFSLSLAATLASPEQLRTIYIDNVRWDTQLPGTLAQIKITPNQAPNPVFVPLGYKVLFTATGFDATGAQLDISPAWDFVGAALGTLSNTVGPNTLMTASNSQVNGSIRASVGGVSGTSLVNVAPVVFTGATNIYSDLGVGGTIGITVNPIQPGGTDLGLKELIELPQNPNDAPEGIKFMNSTYTLVNSVGKSDAYAVWHVSQPNFPRYMGGYETGYLHFFVRTTRNLEISIRSRNVDSATNRAKILLSEFGIPLNNNWQEVVIPLDSFKQKEPSLDYSQMEVFFSVGATSALIGPQASVQSFDIDDVRWLTTSPNVPDVRKVYAGLKTKQNSSTGLVRSFDVSPSAFTYDQALAAMAFTYQKDAALSKKIFDFYRSRYGAGFDGFSDSYNVGTGSVMEAGRTVGPNAFLLLSLIHYKNVTGSTDYDAMMAGVANWIVSFQKADGGVSYGRPTDPNVVNIKSTEQNMDAYAALNAYGKLTGVASYASVSQRILTWLQTTAWNNAEQRFNIGTKSDGTTMSTDKALDAYSFAPLALSGYSSVLNLAQRDFVSTHTCVRTGLLVGGFDFSGGFQVNGTPVDKDAVWLEGTAQMVLAYLTSGDQNNATLYLNELNKAVFNQSVNEQGLAYASNEGTAYSFTMNGNEAAVSSMAWYVFANNNFNPFRVFAIFNAEPKNISDNMPANPPMVQWQNALPASGWLAASQYIQLDAQPITSDPWGIQIFTNNTAASAVPQFADPTPGLPNNLDSDPSGLLLDNGVSPTSARLPVAWSIKDKTGTSPVAANPNNINDPNSFQWLFMLDKLTPGIDRNIDGDINDTDPIANPDPDRRDSLPFQEGDSFVRVRDRSGIHFGQRPTDFSKVDSPDYIYFESDFGSAAAQVNYKSVITLEYFFE